LTGKIETRWRAEMQRLLYYESAIFSKGRWMDDRPEGHRRPGRDVAVMPTASLRWEQFAPDYGAPFRAGDEWARHEVRAYFAAQAAGK